MREGENRKEETGGARGFKTAPCKHLDALSPPHEALYDFLETNNMAPRAQASWDRLTFAAEGRWDAP